MQPRLDLTLHVAEFFRLPGEMIFNRGPFTPMSEQRYPVGTGGAPR